MRLAQAGRSADEERVVGEPGHLGDGERGGVRQAVGVADDELLEGLAGIEGRLVRWRRGRPCRRGCGVRRGAVARHAVHASAAGRVPRRRRERGDELDLDVGAEHRGEHACSRRPKRSAIQRLVSSGASISSAPFSCRAVSGSSHWCQVDSGTARRARRGSAARTMRARDRTRTRGRASSAWEVGAAMGTEGPGGPRRAEHSIGSGRRADGPAQNARKSRRPAPGAPMRGRCAQLCTACRQPCAPTAAGVGGREPPRAVGYPVGPARIRRADLPLPL